MEKAICTLFFLKISRKICVSPKIHGGQPKNQNDRKFAGNKKKMQEKPDETAARAFEAD